MSADQVFTGPRLSAAVRCPRTAVYQALGAEGRVPTDREQRMFRRGHAIADVTKAQIIGDLAARGVACDVEAAIPWPADAPIGRGHADLIAHEAEGVAVIEITTTQGCELAEHKALQAAAYAIEHPTATAATVLVVDPVTGEEQAYPINVDGLRDKWIEIRDAVVAGIRDGVLPDRVCRHPNDGPAMFCPYGGRDGHCFRDWVDEFDRVDAADLFQELARVEDEIAACVPAGLDELKARRDALRAEAAMYVEPGREAVAGGVSVRVTQVSASAAFSLAAMRKAGWDLPSELEAFVTRRNGHERWTVKRVEVPDAA